MNRNSNKRQRHHQRIEATKKNWYMYICSLYVMCVYCWTIVAVCIHRTFSESFLMCGFCFVFPSSFSLAPTHTHSLTRSHSFLSLSLSLYYNCIYLVYMQKCFCSFARSLTSDFSFARVIRSHSAYPMKTQLFLCVLSSCQKKNHRRKFRKRRPN